jgi:spore coat protein H
MHLFMLRHVFLALSLSFTWCHGFEAVLPPPKTSEVKEQPPAPAVEEKEEKPKQETKAKPAPKPKKGAEKNAEEETPKKKKVDEADTLFVKRMVPRLSIEIPEEGMKTLRNYNYVWRQNSPERIDVKATVREGEKVYTDVAIHLKGSYTFAPVDSRPSLTLNFDKFHQGQRFHGLSKLHLNNTVQDSSYLSEAFARDLFNDLGVPAPRAGHAVVTLNGRRIGLYVLLEGANKPFLKQHFSSLEGNLYDAGSGGEITKALKVDFGDNREDRSELDKLAKAAEEPNPVERWKQLEKLLDVDQFLSFVAGEVLLVHWDGYATGAPNNYRVFYDAGRGKFTFMPHGLDQLLRSGASAQKLTPHFTGMVARGLMTTPEGRRRYLERIASIAGKEFTREALLGRVTQLAAALRAGLAGEPDLLAEFDGEVDSFKSTVTNRTETVARLLKSPPQPVTFDATNTMALSGWQFKSSNTSPATGRKVMVENREILQVQSRGPGTSGSWRTVLLLDDGHYEFTARVRTEGFKAGGDPAKDVPGNADAGQAIPAKEPPAKEGVILRMSGEKKPESSTSAEWTTVHYAFAVQGIEDVELVCEFRGAQGTGMFDPASMRLTRRP